MPECGRPEDTMRIIGGSARGRVLLAPEGLGTRPMLDLQKERVFNILQAEFPNVGVLDVFAGSGALGIEALSRGSLSATFVERSVGAASVIQRNLEDLGFADRGRVLKVDAYRFDPARLQHSYGLIFLDPPFPLYAEAPAAVHALAARLMFSETATEDVVMVFRVPTPGLLSELDSRIQVADERRAGESVIFFLRRAQRAVAEIPSSDRVC